MENSKIQSNAGTENLTLDKCIKIIRRDKVILIGCLAVFLIWGLIYSFTVAPVYQAQVKIQIDSKLSEAVPIGMDQSVRRGEKPQEFYLTQYILLKSRSLAKNVIQQLKLEESAELNGAPSFFNFSFIKNIIKSVFQAVFSGDSEEGSNSSIDPYSKLVDKFLRKLIISPIRNSHIVEIKYQSTSPKNAADIANTLAGLYIQRNLEWRTSTEEDAGNGCKLEWWNLRSKSECPNRPCRNLREYTILWSWMVRETLSLFL